MNPFKKTKAILGLTLAISAFGGLGTSPASAAGKVNILLDGYPLPFPTQPAIVKGTTLVPFRAISEALGVTVNWNEKSKSITAVKTTSGVTKRVTLTLGSKNALVNGQKVAIALPPQTIGGTTMIPLSFFSQQFGAAVKWDGPSNTVTIGSPREKLYTLAFYAMNSYSESAMIPDFDAVGFGWSRIDATGAFTTSGTDFRWPKPAGEVTPESLVIDTAAAGTLPYLLVFSGDTKGELTKIVEDQTARENAIKQIIDTAVKSKFKGVLLDLEGLGLTGDAKAVQASYNNFVQETAHAAHAAGLKLSLALPPLNGAYHGYDYKKLGELADELIIMAYAYTNEKLPQPADQVDNAIKLALKSVPKDKLVLGVNLYSENEHTVNTKVGLAKRYGLKGLAFWRLGFGKQNVWDKINESIELTEN
ncbi:stalk domain-containing protein [Paenibacillus sp. YPG26]|uniref:stalk domain-containing protein n=1 Tax=Paenibacillus sp. YPG26 TaxID=2878915 RepID=UPI00203FD9FA|nr:stalk domain-containing protein [Paenibacillus sp. YPG26]USB33430.1 glycosyl hydrolase [Paenibacillus sp. YPG26]